jgi:hypothetical protein
MGIQQSAKMDQSDIRNACINGFRYQIGFGGETIVGAWYSLVTAMDNHFFVIKLSKNMPFFRSFVGFLECKPVLVQTIVGPWQVFIGFRRFVFFGKRSDPGGQPVG